MNIPIELTGNVLYLGMGGGFDIYGAIPLLSSTKGNITLANLSLESKEFGAFHVSGCDDSDDSPEKRLLGRLSIDCPIYVIPKCGVKSMYNYLKVIVDEEKIDTIVCVDGGVDSLMTGEEENSGTILEDTVTLAAVSQFNLKKYLVNVGFGTELEEDLSHYHALQNMAALSDAFLGSCSLVKNMPEYQLYKEVCEWGWAERRKSHIHTKVISSIEGKFGNENLYDDIDARVGGVKVINFTTPFMGIYWFFDLDKVAARNILVKPLSISNTFTDVMILYKQLNLVKKKKINFSM
jgi:hypothetical protein